MPIYEYECTACQFRFERKQTFDDQPIAICPQCQGKVRRLFYPAPAIFKGSGFYTTDNRKGAVPEDLEGKKALPGEGKGEKEKAVSGKEKEETQK